MVNLEFGHSLGALKSQKKKEFRSFFRGTHSAYRKRNRPLTTRVKN